MIYFVDKNWKKKYWSFYSTYKFSWSKCQRSKSALWSYWTHKSKWFLIVVQNIYYLFLLVTPAISVCFNQPIPNIENVAFLFIRFVISNIRVN